MKKVGHVFKIIGNVVLWLFVAFAVAITVLVFTSQQPDNDGLPVVMGKSIVNIVSDSMEPTLKVGDLIIDEGFNGDAAKQRDCKVGEIITFRSDLDGNGEEELNTHRIVEVYEEGGYTYYITKGDNNTTNPVNDENPVESNKVIAKYTGIRLARMGSFIAFLQTSVGFLCVIVIPLVLFFLFELFMFITTVTRLRGKKVSPEQEEEIKRRAVEEYLKQQGDSPDEAAEAPAAEPGEEAKEAPASEEENKPE